MALYAIGDIQGCMASLERLLVAIDYAPARDRLWLVGDLVNRGPRSLDVLRWARAQGDRVTVVLGNHELHLLARIAGVSEAKRRDTLDAVLAAPDRDPLADWLRARPLCHVEDDHVLVHAGLHPSWTAADALARAAELEAGLRGAGWRTWLGRLAGPPAAWHDALAGDERLRAIAGFLVRVRTLGPDGVPLAYDGPPAGAPAGARPWYTAPSPAWSDHTIVFGHWAAHGFAVGARWIALDSGCVYGGRLTAVRLPDRAVFQVNSVEGAS